MLSPMPGDPRAAAALMLLAGGLAAADDPEAQPLLDDRGGLSALELFDPLGKGWSHGANLGLFGNSTTTRDASASRDPTIAGAASSMSAVAKADLRSVYQAGPDSVEHLLTLRYGRMRDAAGAVSESEDEARYDGTYRRVLSRPHFLYGALGAQTVFTGPDPGAPGDPPDDRRNPFDPLSLRASIGYGQRYEQWLPDDFLEWRVGVRAQRRWATAQAAGERAGSAGWEVYARYENTPSELKKLFTWFLQYEAYCEFDDPAHVANLVTGNMSWQLRSHVQIQLSLRAYYESRPRRDTDHAYAGYDRWSWKQDALLGLTWTR